MGEVSIKRFVRAPCEDVWAVYAEIEGWSFWAGLGPVELEQPGAAEPNGAGAIRAIRAAGLVLRERISIFERPFRIQTALVSGRPFRHLDTEVVFEQRPHGTVVRCRTSFAPKLPGTDRALELALKLTQSTVLSRLENRLAPLESHRTQCPYADAVDGHPRSLRLRGRAVVNRALLEARTLRGAD